VAKSNWPGKRKCENSLLQKAVFWHFSVIIVVLLAGVIIGAIPGSYAADDSNSGQLTQSQTLDPQALSSTLGNLTQGLNNTQVQQLVGQLQSQLNSGNNSGASSTLKQIQGVLNNQSGSQGVPDSLGALLNSLSAGPNGISINPSLLSSLLGLDSSSGLPSNLQNMSPQSASTALKALSYLLRNVNPSLAEQMLSESSALQQSIGNTNSTLPSGPGIPKGGFSTPTIKPPSLNGGANVAKLPTITPETIILPLVIVGALVALYFSRNRLSSALGRQLFPGQSKRLDLDAPAYDPNSPRSRILYAFAKAVGVMRLKGFEKYTYESHREFAAKCGPSADSPHVSTISSLYEKAKFSGKDVSTTEADQATLELSAIDQRSRRN
jgi:hypothetical protein